MKTYLPNIRNELAAVQGMNSNAVSFTDAWMQVLDARAKLMRVDERLVRVANDHALYLSQRTPEQIEALPDDGHGSHVGLNNSTPNQRVRAAGYRLPESHGGGNTVEFNARTHKGPLRALELYMGSDAHRPALMGENFWEPATVYGVANVGDDWVVLVCPPEGAI